MSRAQSDDVDWQVKLRSLSQRGLHILKTGLWSDCKFLVGNDDTKQEFQAHKLILSMASPVFEKMFHSSFTETKNDTVEIVDIQPDAFGAMLSYVYGDLVDLQSFNQACELCYVANKYMMPNLLQDCTSYIWRDVNTENACRGLEFAMLFDQHDLMEKCKKIICQQTSEVLQDPHFVEVQMSTLKMILDQPRLTIGSEMELFNAVERWTDAEFDRLGISDPDFEEKRRSIYGQLLPKICFLSMSAKDFAEGPALSPMLTKDQSFAILMNVISKNSECPMPEGFSTRIRQAEHEVASRNVTLKLHLENFSPTHNFQPTESTIWFCCNKDVELLGVMVMGQLPYLNSPTLSNNMKLFNHMQKYMENLDVFIEDQSSNDYAETSFNSAIEYRSLIDIRFPKPFRLFHGRTYKLGIIMNQPGLYMAGTLNFWENSYNSLKFTLISSTEPMFIHAIVISKQIIEQHTNTRIQ